MEVLWSPWRLDYILGPKPEECVFCLPKATDEDEERLVLHRGSTCFVIMNKFPYNNGHLMVCPLRHTSCLTTLTEEELVESARLVRMAVSVLHEAFNPQGVNVGLNLGVAAGAGIAAHLHWQLVPRWSGDASFMAVFAETTVIPEHLQSTYNRLKPLFEKRAAKE
jgi:ATP adenylyltransferase